jgi:anthranilate phosphoribosyltransferase
MDSEHVFVVHGKDGMDEITLTSNTIVAELKDGVLKEYELNPRHYGFNLCKPEDLLGGSPNQKADITTSILLGGKGPKRDIVLLNAAAAIIVSKRAENFHEALPLAEKSIDSGIAYQKLEKLIKLTKA